MKKTCIFLATFLCLIPLVCLGFDGKLDLKILKREQKERYTCICIDIHVWKWSKILKCVIFRIFFFISGSSIFFLIQLISSEQCNPDGCFKRGKKKRHSWRVGVHEYVCTTYAASATDRTWTEYIINVRPRCISDHSVL